MKKCNKAPVLFGALFLTACTTTPPLNSLQKDFVGGVLRENIYEVALKKQKIRLLERGAIRPFDEMVSMQSDMPLTVKTLDMQEALLRKNPSEVYGGRVVFKEPVKPTVIKERLIEEVKVPIKEVEKPIEKGVKEVKEVKGVKKVEEIKEVEEIKKPVAENRVLPHSYLWQGTIVNLVHKVKNEYKVINRLSPPVKIITYSGELSFEGVKDCLLKQGINVELDEVKKEVVVW